jgi:hypothetical protein
MTIHVIFSYFQQEKQLNEMLFMFIFYRKTTGITRAMMRQCFTPPKNFGG